jgi:hypothetical protein
MRREDKEFSSLSTLASAFRSDDTFELSSNPAIAAFGGLLLSKGRFAFEARSNTNDGANVQTFVDLIDPTRVLTVTGVLPKPAANALYGGALACTFNGTQSTVNNKPPSDYRFMHDGTGMETRQLFSSSAGLQYPFGSTIGSGAGFYLVQSSPAIYLGLVGPADANLVSFAFTMPVDTAVSIHTRFTSPNYTHHMSGAGTGTFAQAGSPSSGDPAFAFAVSPTAGASHLSGTWFGSYGFSPLTDAERGIFDAYITLMTGVVDP